jgi:hypothetical protein
MPALVAGIHAVVRDRDRRLGRHHRLFLQSRDNFTAWMPGTRPGMTLLIF